jgi:hypothetical protein
VPKRIVDRLEPVEVQKQERHALLGALGVCERHTQAVLQQRAVGKPGEPVIEGELLHPGLVTLAGRTGLGFLERPPHHRHQPREPLLGHVIRDTGLQRFYHRLLVA